MEPIVLRFQASGLEGITAQIMHTVNRMKQMQTTLNGINRSLAKLKTLDASVTISRTGNAAANSSVQLARYNQQLAITGQLVTGNTGSSISRLGKPGGPYSNIALRKNQLALAQQSGDPLAIADAQSNLLAAYRRLARSQGIKSTPPVIGTAPSFGARLQRAIYSSRFNVGGASPLFGQVAGLAGLTPKNPVTIALLAGLASVAAAGKINGMQGLNLTTANPGSISRMGKVLGFDPMSGPIDFQSSIQSGAGRSFAQRAGINPLYNEFTGQGGDFAEKQSKFIRYYGDPRKSSNRAAAAASRAVGMEQEIGMSRMISPGVRDLVYKPGIQFSKKNMQDSANATALANRGLSEFQMMLNKLGASVLPAVNTVLKDNTRIWNAIAPTINRVFDGLQRFMEFASKMGWFTGLIARLLEWLESNKDEKKAGKDIKEAASDLKDAAKAFRDGVYGQGSERAQNMVTPGIRGATRSGNTAAAEYYAQQGIPL